MRANALSQPPRPEEVVFAIAARQLASQQARCVPRQDAEFRAKLRESIDVLFSLFDDAHRRANQALARAGRAERIAMRNVDGERRYHIADQHGRHQFVSLYLALPLRDGHLFGGAYITTNKTCPSIYLVPALERDRPRWLVTITGTELTADVTYDFFASVFGDDAAATSRIQPLAGLDLFQSPWS